MSPPSTVSFTLPESESQTADFHMFVKHRGRWIETIAYRSLQEAEMMAELAHQRSGLATEIRDADGLVLLAFDPPG